MARENGLHDVYITSCGVYLPGAPIENDELEERLGCVNGKPSRVKRKILESNGIKSRHYALSHEGRATELNEELAARAIDRALAARGMALSKVELLALGTTIGDVLIPGFASMVQGRLGAPPMEVLSVGGVCCSGIGAMQAAYRALRSGTRSVAIAGGSELVSRSLRASRFESAASATDEKGLAFDCEFIRWMLSDGAGVVLLEQRPRPDGLSLRIDWMDLVSRSGENLPCMHAGIEDPSSVCAGTTWLDYPRIADAESNGLLLVRQNIRMLDRMVELGVEHWLRLVQAGWIVPSEIDHVLCHYSSRFFRDRIINALMRAEILPPRGKWFSNLERKGNTGSAAIFIALEELAISGELREGQRILLVVPESARFASCYAQLTVVKADAAPPRGTGSSLPVRTLSHARSLLRATVRPHALSAAARTDGDTSRRASPPPGGTRAASHERLKLDLALVWAEFNALLAQVPIIQRLEGGSLTAKDYRQLIKHLRQQVVDGARWLTQAAASTSSELAWLRSILIKHALEEHRDYELLERDYVAMGGQLEDIQRAPKNLGSEALSGFILQRASLPDPIDLTGAMFIIEGLGMRTAGRFASKLVEHLGLRDDQISFLQYHADRDASHLQQLDHLLERFELDEATCERILLTARTTARLYVLQLEEIDIE